MSNSNTTLASKIQNIEDKSLEKFTVRAQENADLQALAARHPEFVHALIKEQVQQRLLNHSFTLESTLSQQDAANEQITLQEKAQALLGADYDAKLVNAAIALGNSVTTRTVSASVNNELQGTRKFGAALAR